MQRTQYLQFLNILLILFTSNSFAQDQRLYKKRGEIILKLDLFLPTVRLLQNNQAIGFSLEYLFPKRKQSIELLAYYEKYKNERFNEDEIQIIPKYKFYISKNTLHKGWYIGPFIKYSYSLFNEIFFLKEQILFISESIKHSISMGGMIGYQFYPLKHFTINFEIGLGARKTIYEKISYRDWGTGVPEIFYPALKNKLRLDGLANINIGYKF